MRLNDFRWRSNHTGSKLATVSEVYWNGVVNFAIHIYGYIYPWSLSSILDYSSFLIFQSIRLGIRCICSTNFVCFNLAWPLSKQSHVHQAWVRSERLADRQCMLGQRRAEVIFDLSGVFICCLGEGYGCTFIISCSCIACSFSCWGKRCLMFTEHNVRKSCKVS